MEVPVALGGDVAGRLANPATYVLVAGTMLAAATIDGGGWAVKAGDTVVVADTLNMAVVRAANALATAA